MSSFHSLPPLKEIVQRYQLAPTKKLGQNFLFDLNLTDKIVRSAGNLNDVTVLEVGPGPGGLTRSLLASNAKKIIAIEYDPRCVAALNDYLVPVSDGRLTIISGDALTLQPYLEVEGPVAVVANLPYNVATPLLMQWLDDIEHFKSFTLMFQKEVAERIIASSGTKAYGRLSVKSQWLCEAEKLFDLPARAFTPPPKVMSSVVHLSPRAKPQVNINGADLERFSALLFNQRRKTLRAILKPSLVDVEGFFAAVHIDPMQRPEQLTVQQIATLALRYLHHRGCAALHP